MIPIKALIRDGSWLNCKVKEGWTFRIRILKFERLDCAQVDNPEKAEPIQEGAVRWIMELEVVNTSRVYVSACDLEFPMRVVDSDGFEFQCHTDHHLSLHSKFAKTSGLRNFFAASLMPKIKVRGAILFDLPDEDTEYSLAIENGTMEEV